MAVAAAEANVVVAAKAASTVTAAQVAVAVAYTARTRCTEFEVVELGASRVIDVAHVGPLCLARVAKASHAAQAAS